MAAVSSTAVLVRDGSADETRERARRGRYLERCVICHVTLDDMDILAVWKLLAVNFIRSRFVPDQTDDGIGWILGDLADKFELFVRLTTK
jgi:hypothetical protein